MAANDDVDHIVSFGLHQLLGQEERAQISHLENACEYEQNNLSNAPPGYTIVRTDADATEIFLA